MTPVDRLSPASIAPLGSAGASGASQVARAAMDELGGRVLAWVRAAGGEGSAEQWAARSGTDRGVASGFAPDAVTLAARGDIYGIRALSQGIAERFGATPTQEGDLQRALEDFTRAAMVQTAGLSGAGDARQTAGLAAAIDLAAAERDGGIDAVVQQIGRAAADLERQNGG